MRFVIFCLFCSLSAMAQNTGAGFMLGNPTAIVGKWVQDQRVAYQGGLAFDFDDAMLVFGDYLLQYPGALKTQQSVINRIVPYIGFGGVIAITTEDRRRDEEFLGKDSGSFGMGVRVPLGLELRFQDPSIGVFLALAPGISIFPETSAYFMGGLGGRFYF